MNVVTALTVYNAHEAIDFYQYVFKAELLGEIVMLDSTPGFENSKYEGLVAHSALRIGNTTLFINDQIEGEIQEVGRSIQMCVFFDTLEELQKVFKILKKEGTVEREIEREHWGATSASIMDKFHVVWHLYKTD